jgi:mRNA interferase HigB
MKLVGLPNLEESKRRHPVLRGPLDAWRREVEEGEWRGPSDVRRRYPGASFLAGNLVVFNIKGNAHRLVVRVSYPIRVVMVSWIGTHAEYDKKKF